VAGLLLIQQQGLEALVVVLVTTILIQLLTMQEPLEHQAKAMLAVKEKTIW
jgi:hypothetical protein